MRKRLGERADRAAFLCFRADLRAAVSGDQEKRYLRLEIAQIGDDFKTGDIGEKQIDDAETKVSFARLVDALETFSDEHDFVAFRLQHEPERVAY